MGASVSGTSVSTASVSDAVTLVVSVSVFAGSDEGAQPQGRSIAVASTKIKNFFMSNYLGIIFITYII